MNVNEELKVLGKIHKKNNFGGWVGWGEGGLGWGGSGWLGGQGGCERNVGGRG